jgi:hypothetical protein
MIGVCVVSSSVRLPNQLQAIGVTSELNAGHDDVGPVCASQRVGRMLNFDDPEGRRPQLFRIHLAVVLKKPQQHHRRV